MKKKVATETVIRTIVLAVTPFAEDELYSILTAAASVAAAVWAWWKNNSFTAEAIEADKYLAELKTAAEDDETEE